MIHAMLVCSHSSGVSRARCVRGACACPPQALRAHFFDAEAASLAQRVLELEEKLGVALPGARPERLGADGKRKKPPKGKGAGGGAGGGGCEKCGAPGCVECAALNKALSDLKRRWAEFLEDATEERRAK